MVTKFKILEVIIKNRNENFDAIRIALMREFPEMSWEDLKDFIVLLRHEGYVKTLYADDDLFDVCLQPGTKARLQDIFETTENEKLKSAVKALWELFKISAF